MIKVVINNRNRLTTTKNMVEKLLSLNPLVDIIILDNDEKFKMVSCNYSYILGLTCGINHSAILTSNSRLIC